MRFFRIAMYALVALLLVGLSVMAADAEITIDAADMEYDLEGKAVVATGNVILRTEDLEIRSEKLVYYDNGWVEAEGQVFIKSSTGEYQGEKMRYHVRERTGEIQKVRGKDEPYYIAGQSVTITAQEKVVSHGKVTRCERPNPCYHLHAGKIRIKDGRIIIEHGWLSILGIPVLPIPYASLSEDLSAWPEIKLGLNEDRGLYVKANQSFSLSPSVDFLGGIGFGTEKWWNVEGGFRWRPFEQGLGEIYYAAESEKERADLRFSGAWDSFRIDLTAFQEWDEVDEGLYRLTGRWSLWQKDDKRLFFEVEQEYRRARDDQGDWYGGDMPGARLLYAPRSNWLLGYGVRYGDEDIGAFGVSGWSQEVSLGFQEKLGENWLLEFDGAYQWKGNDDHWIRQEIGVTRRFHCYSAKISWDGVEEDWHFSLGINW